MHKGCLPGPMLNFCNYLFGVRQAVLKLSKFVVYGPYFEQHCSPSPLRMTMLFVIIIIVANIFWLYQPCWPYCTHFTCPNSFGLPKDTMSQYYDNPTFSWGSWGANKWGRLPVASQLECGVRVRTGTQTPNCWTPCCPSRWIRGSEQGGNRVLVSPAGNSHITQHGAFNIPCWAGGKQCKLRPRYDSILGIFLL